MCVCVRQLVIYLRLVGVTANRDPSADSAPVQLLMVSLDGTLETAGKLVKLDVKVLCHRIQMLIRVESLRVAPATPPPSQKKRWYCRAVQFIVNGFVPCYHPCRLVVPRGRLERAGVQNNIRPQKNGREKADRAKCEKSNLICIRTARHGSVRASASPPRRRTLPWGLIH